MIHSLSCKGVRIVLNINISPWLLAKPIRWAPIFISYCNCILIQVQHIKNQKNLLHNFYGEKPRKRKISFPPNDVNPGNVKKKIWKNMFSYSLPLFFSEPFDFKCCDTPMSGKVRKHGEKVNFGWANCAQINPVTIPNFLIYDVFF